MPTPPGLVAGQETDLTMHDLSVPISPSMVTWPGDPPVRVEPRLRIALGDSVNVSELCLGSHTGTHVDPPYHFDDQGLRLDEIPLEVLIGRAWVCEVLSEGDIDVTALQSNVPEGTIRLLLKTANSKLWHRDVQEFWPGFVTLTAESAHWILDRGIRLLGVDYLSLDRPESEGFPVHRALLGAGIVVVEGLDLSSLRTGWYNLYCLPLKVTGGDGAPARAVAVGPLQ
jgi:arylformamidase